MLNLNELSTIHKYGRRMHKENDYNDYDCETNHGEGSVASGQPRILIKDPDILTPPFDYADPMNNGIAIARTLLHQSHRRPPLHLFLQDCPAVSLASTTITSLYGRTLHYGFCSLHHRSVFLASSSPPS